jgi:hypothetical protein
MTERKPLTLKISGFMTVHRVSREMTLVISTTPAAQTSWSIDIRRWEWVWRSLKWDSGPPGTLLPVKR